MKSHYHYCGRHYNYRHRHNHGRGVCCRSNHPWQIWKICKKFHLIFYHLYWVHLYSSVKSLFQGHYSTANFWGNTNWYHMWHKTCEYFSIINRQNYQLKWCSRSVVLPTTKNNVRQGYLLWLTVWSIVLLQSAGLASKRVYHRPRICNMLNILSIYIIGMSFDPTLSVMSAGKTRTCK